MKYGYSLEVEGIKSILGNHPLGHVLFFTVYTLAKQLRYDGRALITSQVTNNVLGGLIIAIFFVLLVSIIKVRALYGFGFSVILGVSYGFRFFTGTGDIYHFSILSSLLAWTALVHEISLENRPSPLLSGIFAGLSILFHQLNGLLIPVGIVLILVNGDSGFRVNPPKIKQIAILLGAASVVVFSGYLLLGFIATSSFSLARVAGWMSRYFGDPTYGRYLNNEVLKTAWKTISQSVLFAPQNKVEYLSQPASTVLGVMLIPGLSFNKSLDGRKRVILMVSTLQCLITWPLILWWEPQNPKFWLLTLIPWLTALALSFEAVETSLRNWLSEFGPGLSRAVLILPLIIGLIVSSLNAPYTTGKEDPVAFNAALNAWMNNTSPDDVLITAGDLIPHLRYWGKRPNTVFLYRSLQASETSADDFYDLRNKISQAFCNDHTVLITPAASEYVSDSELALVRVTQEALRSYLYDNARKGKIAFWYRNVFDGKLLPVYVLKRSVPCTG